MMLPTKQGEMRNGKRLKRGRPYIVGVRLSEDEADMLDKLAFADGVSMATKLRQLLIIESSERNGND